MKFKQDNSTLSLLLALVLSCPLIAAAEEKPAATDDELAQSFKSPPPSARPGVYWDWMGGMISREGITKDLEAMAEQGIGKVMIMQLPDQCPFPRQWSYSDYPGKVQVLSKEWFDLVNFAVGECDRLGLEIGTLACPGWGHVGGPWVPEEKGTKILATARVSVSGPSQLSMKLPKPAVSPGARGGNEIPEWNFAHKLLPEPKENFFRDEAVLAFPDPGENGVIPLDQVVDITDHLDAEGKLTWDVPEGNWVIHRICLVSENGINHPAPAESIGLEVDRMDPAAVRIVFDNMIGRILREARAKGYQSFNAYLTDSYETGRQDFGLDFREEFKKRRGYDCTPWLPAWNFTTSNLETHWRVKNADILKKEPDRPGKPFVIGSEEMTQRFRIDMMRTISELWAERFHGALRKLADEHGIAWMTEPYFFLRIDWTTLGGTSTLPGAEFWVGEDGKLEYHVGNAPEIAALYDRKIAWAEAFTAEPYLSAWRNDPWLLKRCGDAAFALGLNLFYLHGFVHNPFSDRYQPGLTMGYWGSHFSRHQTWWPYAGPWLRYLARCQFMLQLGRPHFDVLRYPSGFDNMPTTVHESYPSARLTDELLMDKLTVRDGKLVLPHGAEFSAIYLPGAALRAEALAKIKTLVEQGATLIGDSPPRWSASLENYPDCDKKMADLIDAIWGTQVGKEPATVRQLGKGRVLSGMTLELGMQEIGKKPGFTYEATPGAARPDLRWNRRTSDDETLWFVSNQEVEKIEVTASFDVNGLQPEWWNPVDGSVRELPAFEFKEGRTLIPLALEPLQSGFVVFRKKAGQGTENTESNFPKTATFMEVPGPWAVSFDPGRGGPVKPVTFPHLTDWSANDEAGIKYFSGKAVYRKTLDVPNREDLPATGVFLDLGVVNDLAQVTLNGEDLGVVWCAPWRVPVPTELLKENGNELEITVVNNWSNRLIGDEQEPVDFETEPGNQTGTRLGGYAIDVKGRALKDLPEWLIKNTPRPSSGRQTFTTWFYYDRDAPLQKAGLLGPVRLVQKRE